MGVSIQNQAKLNRIEVWILSKILARQLALKKYVISGSYRRGKWKMNDIDLLIEVNSESQKEGYRQLLKKNGWRLTHSQPNHSKDLLREQFFKSYGNKFVVLDLFMCYPGYWGNALFFSTGSRRQNDIIRANLRKRNISWDNPLFFRDLEKHISVSFQEEQGVFNYLGLKYVPPRRRL